MLELRANEAAGRKGEIDRSAVVRVCVAGTLHLELQRNRHLLALLRRAGCDLDLRSVRFWRDRRGRVVQGGPLRLAFRLAWVLPLAAWRFLRAPRPDVLLVGFPGPLDMPWLTLLARLRRVPVVLDVFVSLFDTLVTDRRLVPAGSFGARSLALGDRLACRLADVILADTPAHARFLARLTGVPEDRFRVLWIGADEDHFHPRNLEPEPGLVLFYGTYIPLHGIETIVRAAKLLEGEPVRFRLVGRGQTRPAIERLARELEVENLELADPLPITELPEALSRAAVCLGIFGTGDKALRVVPTKLFEAIAMARPVITADSQAIRDAFGPEELVTVPPGDPEALAAAIRRLVERPADAERIGRAGHRRYLRDYSQSALARLLASHLDELARVSRPPGALSRPPRDAPAAPRQ